MYIDPRLVALGALGAVLALLTWLVGLNVALGVLIVGAIAWSVSPLNGPSRR